MQILAVDIGTGTQDIYLFQAGQAPENGFKLVVPAPTMSVRRRILEATRQGEALLLTGVTMGGGPCHWAAEDHLSAGLRIFATPGAARTFNDDLDWVRREMGIEIVAEDEASRLSDVVHLELKDFDYQAIVRAFASFEVDLRPKAVAVSVFDHGEAPPEVSDRQFRFDYLEERIRSENRLLAFAYLSHEVPPSMTRMMAVAQSAGELDLPLVLMDTAPAAILGATLDPAVRDRDRLLIANIGNFHTLAFRLGPSGIEGLFEHHTGLLNLQRLETLILRLADGSLTHEEVFGEHGHGSLLLHPNPLPIPKEGFGVVVTGPRRDLMTTSSLRPHFAVPFGDMMLTGCFGLLLGVAAVLPELAQPIRHTLSGKSSHVAPWDVAPVATK